MLNGTYILQLARDYLWAWTKIVKSKGCNDLSESIKENYILFWKYLRETNSMTISNDFGMKIRKILVLNNNS